MSTTNNSTVDAQRLAELKEQRKRIDDEINQVLVKAKNEVIADILRTMAEFNIEIADIEKIKKRSRRGPRPSAKPKYRDPQTGAEWSGRGNRPHWAQGDLKQYLIK